MGFKSPSPHHINQQDLADSEKYRTVPLRFDWNAPPGQLGSEHIRKYRAHLFTDRTLDATCVSQQPSALRFFFVKKIKCAEVRLVCAQRYPAATAH